MKVAFIGSGLQTKRRAPVVNISSDDSIIAIAGVSDDPPAMCQDYDCIYTSNWHDIIKMNDVETVIITTPPNLHAEIAVAAMSAGKNVFCEKPLARTLEEAQLMVNTARDTGMILKCGFNHRHHPAFLEAYRRYKTGDFGSPISISCKYGICGRPGYENEWRANPNFAAGGQYAEQGVHAIDLFRWFLGELDEVACMTSRKYFTNQSLEDNGMAIFRSKKGATAMLHSSLTHWKNGFSFHFVGEDGYFEISGLGGSYGTEKLLLGKRDFDAPFQDHIIEYRGDDKSWKNEWFEFKNALEHGREPLGNGIDGLEASRAVAASYLSEKTRTIIKIEEIQPNIENHQ